MTRNAPLTLTVNGREVSRTIPPQMLLVEFLREELRLTGPHVGCDTTQCGCCAVHLDGQVVKACTVLAMQAQGHVVQTIEGMAGATLHPMQQAFIDHHALQCGYCTPGMIMTCIAVARDHAPLTEAEARHQLEGNICRCTGYNNIVAALLDGQARMQGGDDVSV